MAIAVFSWLLEEKIKYECGKCIHHTMSISAGVLPSLPKSIFPSVSNFICHHHLFSSTPITLLLFHLLLFHVHVPLSLSPFSIFFLILQYISSSSSCSSSFSSSSFPPSSLILLLGFLFLNSFTFSKIRGFSKLKCCYLRSKTVNLKKFNFQKQSLTQQEHIDPPPHTHTSLSLSLSLSLFLSLSLSLSQENPKQNQKMKVTIHTTTNEHNYSHDYFHDYFHNQNVFLNPIATTAKVTGLS